jgi:hypothetical protein
MGDSRAWGLVILTGAFVFLRRGKGTLFVVKRGGGVPDVFRGVVGKSGPL